MPLQCAVTWREISITHEVSDAGKTCDWFSLQGYHDPEQGEKEIISRLKVDGWM